MRDCQELELILLITIMNYCNYLISYLNALNILVNKINQIKFPIVLSKALPRRNNLRKQINTGSAGISFLAPRGNQNFEHDANRVIFNYRIYSSKESTGHRTTCP